MKNINIILASILTVEIIVITGIVIAFLIIK